jgi:hypothetical protein
MRFSTFQSVSPWRMKQMRVVMVGLAGYTLRHFTQLPVAALPGCDISRAFRVALREILPRTFPGAV